MNNEKLLKIMFESTANSWLDKMDAKDIEFWMDKNKHAEVIQGEFPEWTEQRVMESVERNIGFIRERFN